MDDYTNENGKSYTYGKYLTFAVGDIDYGLGIDYVTEIIQMQSMQAITALPHLPLYIKGVINLRSKIIPVMDIRTRFGKPWRDPDNKTCIIVVNAEGTDIGLIVDTVRESIDIDDDDITLPSEAKSGQDNKYIKAIGKTEKGIKLLIDLERVVTDVE